VTGEGHHEEGQVAGLEAIAFGFLILVLGVLLVSNAWGVIDAKTAARVAAREAARAYAKAGTGDATAAEDAADRAARGTLTDLGWTRTDITVHPDHPVFERCAVITYTVTVPVPVFRLPGLTSGPAGFRATAHHTERVDPYRSGIPGDPAAGGAADCSGAER